MKKLVLFALFVLVLMPVQADAFKSWQRFGVLTGGVVADNTTLAFTLPVNVGHNSVHPRVCGERLFPVDCTWAIDGSSPRVRGTVWNKGFRNVGFRFIPACAGNGSPSSPQWSDLPVHPHVCGERTAGAAQAANRTFIVFGN